MQDFCDEMQAQNLYHPRLQNFGLIVDAFVVEKHGYYASASTAK